MIYWWIADAVLVLVVVPVVVAILVQVLIPIFQIKRYADDIIDAAGHFPSHLDDITAELLKTRDLVKHAGGPEIVRFSRAVDNL
jgi:hypothetical protein